MLPVSTAWLSVSTRVEPLTVTELTVKEAPPTVTAKSLATAVVA